MTSIITVVLSVLGSIIVAYISNNKKEERKIQLFEKLSTALSQEKSTKLEVCEYFRLATGIRMKYSDIKTLVNDENSIWMIYFLQSRSGYVTYEDGKLTYTKRFDRDKRRKVFLSFENVTRKMLMYSSGTLYVLSFIAMLFAKNTVMTIVAILFLFGSALMYVSLSRDGVRTEKLEELLALNKTIEKKHP